MCYNLKKMKKTIIFLTILAVLTPVINAEFLHLSLDATYISKLHGVTGGAQYGLGVSAGVKLSRKSLLKGTFYYYPSGDTIEKNYQGDTPPTNVYAYYSERSIFSVHLTLIRRNRLFNRIFNIDSLDSYSIIGLSYFRQNYKDKHWFPEGPDDEDNSGNKWISADFGYGLKIPFNDTIGLYFDARVMVYLTYLNLPLPRFSGGFYIDI